MNETKPSPLAQLRTRLQYNATALICSLGPKDCAEMLALVAEAELQLTAALMPKATPTPSPALTIAPGRYSTTGGRK